MGHSDWYKPRLYRYDLAKEREHTPSVRSVVVIPSDPDQPEAEPEVEVSQEQELSPTDMGPNRRMALAGLVSSPVTSLPCTPGRDIHLPGDSEESRRSRDCGLPGCITARCAGCEMGSLQHERQGHASQLI